MVNHSPTPLATGRVDLQWTAPAEPEVPNVLFRVASNSANGNDSATGDHIHRLQLTLPQTIECAYSLTTETDSFDSEGGNGSASVAAPEGCGWTAASSDDWITITGEASGSGDGSISFTVEANMSALPRSGSLMVEDQVLNVSQTGVECFYALSRDSISFDSDEGSSSVDVTAPEGCGWSASPSESWLTITDGASGNGNGEVLFTVEANPASEARSGSITVEDQVLAVSQSAQEMADLIFPQFLNGEINGVLNGTRVILTNGGAEAASGQIRFRESSSLFAAVPVNGQITDTVEFSIEPRGTFEVETDGTGLLQTGVVEVFVDGETDSVQGTEIFSVLGNFVSVPAGRRDLAPQTYLSVNLAPKEVDESGLNHV